MLAPNLKGETATLLLCRSSAITRQRWEHEYDLERRGAAYVLTFRREEDRAMSSTAGTELRFDVSRGLTATRPAFMKTENDRRRCRPLAAPLCSQTGGIKLIALPDDSRAISG